MLLSISQGKYELNSAMNIQIQSNIEFEYNKKYSISGENGSGKSSFVRNIIYKSVSKNCKGKVQYIYFDQEILLQYYYVKAYISMKEHKKINSISAFITKTIELHKANNIYNSNKLVVILDETDKYIDTSIIFSLIKDYEYAFINISHSTNDNLKYDKVIEINKIDDNNATLKVK
jgi:predicted ATPase